MEYLTLAGEAVRLIAGYASSLEDLVGGVRESVGRMIAHIRSAFSSSKSDNDALDRLLAEPGSSARQAVLTGLLVQAFEGDPALYESVRSLVEQAQAIINATNVGIVTAQGDVKLTGKYVAGRDLHIGHATDDEDG
jgi:hypothetical protein